MSVTTSKKTGLIMLFIITWIILPLIIVYHSNSPGIALFNLLISVAVCIFGCIMSKNYHDND